MTTTKVDLSSCPPDGELSRIATIGRALFAAEQEVLRLEVELKKAKRARDFIAQNELPTALEEVGLEGFKTDGFEVKVKEITTVSPLKENRPLVMKLLEEMGQSALIKSTISVSFSRGKEEQSEKLLTDLTRAGLQPKREQWVEPQTLKKFVKDRLENGEAVDKELFGVRQFKEAQFESGAPEAAHFEGE